MMNTKNLSKGSSTQIWTPARSKTWMEDEGIGE